MNNVNTLAAEFRSKLHDAGINVSEGAKDLNERKNEILAEIKANKTGIFSWNTVKALIAAGIIGVGIYKWNDNDAQVHSNVITCFNGVDKLVELAVKAYAEKTPPNSVSNSFIPSFIDYNGQARFDPCYGNTPESIQYQRRQNIYGYCDLNSVLFPYGSSLSYASLTKIYAGIVAIGGYGLYHYIMKIWNHKKHLYEEVKYIENILTVL